jgi:hypothetical protein
VGKAERASDGPLPSATDLAAAQTSAAPIFVIAAAAHNPGRVVRKLFGIGMPRTLQDLADLIALAQLLVMPWMSLLIRSIWRANWAQSMAAPAAA